MQRFKDWLIRQLGGWSDEDYTAACNYALEWKAAYRCAKENAARDARFAQADMEIVERKMEEMQRDMHDAHRAFANTIELVNHGRLAQAIREEVATHDRK